MELSRKHRNRYTGLATPTPSNVSFSMVLMRPGKPIRGVVLGTHIWKDAERKFVHTIDPVFLGGELLKVNRIAALPRMAQPLTVEALKSFFAAQAKTLAPSVFE